MTNPATRFSPETQRQDQTPPRCIVCGGDKTSETFASVEPEFSVLVCPDCGLGRTWPPLPADKIGAYYPREYYGRENVRFNPLFEAMTLFFHSLRAHVLPPRVPPVPVLDARCRTGFPLA